MIKLVLGEETINIISAYAPQIGLKEFIKQKFGEENQNGHVGKDSAAYDLILTNTWFKKKDLHLGSFYNTHTLFVDMIPTQLIPSNVMLILSDFLYILNLNNK